LATDTICSISWQKDFVKILDQTKLPAAEIYLECRNVEAVAHAIERLCIRGAPAIGIAAAMALALEAQSSKSKTAVDLINQLASACVRLKQTRPTAVNLQWALNRIMDKVRSRSSTDISFLKSLVIKEAMLIHHEDIENNMKIAEYGQTVIPDPATVLTICNTGSLATGGYGTALGVIKRVHAIGRKISVIACETRPLLQGARLTAWELKKAGIPFKLITDSMAGYFMKVFGADLVIAGADRIAANGDTANKIGTYSLAVLAKNHAIPFFIAAPISTIDATIHNGNEIVIEERSPEEITAFQGIETAPVHTDVWNPSFDIVPSKYITGIITERGIIRRPFTKGICRLCCRN